MLKRNTLSWFIKLSLIINLNSIAFSYSQNSNSFINEHGINIRERFSVSVNYKRVDLDTNSFAFFLQKLPLRPNNSPVKLYNGAEKVNQNVHVAVVDIEIGKKDLQQCADAIIRLRAEFLYSKKLYDSISFHLTNGFKVDFIEWINGKRVVFEGEKTFWRKLKPPFTSHETLREYLDFVFTYAGTISLSKELKPVRIKNIQVGDVFIQGGSPGHAVIVVDMAINYTTGEKLFLLAQSYMPAQDIHILINPNNPDISPWYSIKFGETLATPEWNFTKNDLKRF